MKIYTSVSKKKTETNNTGLFLNDIIYKHHVDKVYYFKKGK